MLLPSVFNKTYKLLLGCQVPRVPALMGGKNDLQVTWNSTILGIYENPGHSQKEH